MIEIGQLEATDIDTIVDVGGDREHGMPSFWHVLLEEQTDGERITLVARDSEGVVGYVHLKWRSKYPRFAEASIPEVSDLRVASRAWRQGVATSLIARCERLACDAGHTMVGIGVGLYADYGPAQRLYAKLGCEPDGFGATYNNEPVTPVEPRVLMTISSCGWSESSRNSGLPGRDA
jgi:GNAT superfamily N-acetyltransferase